MPDATTSLAIIDLAYRTEMMARDLYALFAEDTEEPDLKEFWLRLSEDEGSHLDFWKSLIEMRRTLPLTMTLEDPDAMLSMLETTLDMASDAVDRAAGESEGAFSATEALLTAYRLEFHMLDPAFQTLFQSLRFLKDDFDPVEEYDHHIDSFVQGLLEFGSDQLETRLLAQTLKRLWSDNKRLAVQAFEDSLTGALNRRGFMTMGVQICALMRRRHSPVGLIMLDLDRFKHLNDTKGHTQGDLALVKTVSVLRGMLRESDLVGRYGGDEFMVLLPDTQRTEAVARKLVQGLDDSLMDSFGITVTAGQAQDMIDCDNVADCLMRLLRKADEDLCRRKNDSRGPGAAVRE